MMPRSMIGPNDETIKMERARRYGASRRMRQVLNVNGRSAAIKA